MNVTLSLTDLLSISPLLILLAGGLALLLFESFAEKASIIWAAPIAGITFVAALAAAIAAPVGDNSLLTSWIKFDGLYHFFTYLFLIVGLASVLLTIPYFQEFPVRQGEFYFLLLLTVFGAIMIGGAADFLTLFLGLETLSIALYVLCSYMKKWELSHEAAIKYFLMGSVATGFLIYGIALVYGATGITNFEGLLPAYKAINSQGQKNLFLAGIAMVTIGLGFKAAIVPFHTWAPDVYDGAPTPVTAFMSVGTKVAAFAALVRIFFIALPQFDVMWSNVLAFLAYPTLIYANFVALRQRNMRRFFAYSGISHAGFLLIPLAVGTPEALSSLLFYLVVYAFATLGCFAAMAYIDRKKEGVFLNDLHGFYARAPWLTALLVICLLTLAGIPPTVGFFAKFFLLKVAFDAKFYGLVITGLLVAVLSAFYYLRVVAVMLSGAPNEIDNVKRYWPAAIVAVIAFVSLLALSVYPEPLYDLITKIV